MRVLKFGGKSLANGEPLRLSLRIIQDVVASDDNPPLVVVSARGKTTDRLLELAHLAEAGKPWRESYRQLLSDQGEGTEGLSDRLTRLLEGIELLRECSAKTLDEVLSFGELFSAHHIARLLPHALPIDAGTSSSPTAPTERRVWSSRSRRKRHAATSLTYQPAHSRS